MIERIENAVIAKYGFENWRTILIFSITEKFHKTA